jgi:hypothetical protein
MLEKEALKSLSLNLCAHLVHRSNDISLMKLR